jgi:hypothetical protein
MGTATRRRASEAAALALGAIGLLAAAGAPAGGGPAPAAAEAAPEARALLGASEAELRARVGALREVEVEPVRSLHERILEGAEPRAGAKPEQSEGDVGAAQSPFRDQRRLIREPGEGEVARAEYDLYRGRVYRVRWRLPERFERPVMEPAVAHLSARLGEPAYDQTVEAKLGSGKATLRRAGWRRGGHALELRQLSPFSGGPLYLTLSDVATLEAIFRAQVVPLPQPETTEPWWKHPQRPPALLTPVERKHLWNVLDELVARMGFQSPDRAEEAPG